MDSLFSLIRIFINLFIIINKPTNAWIYLNSKNLDIYHQ
eukprot:COSAG01_NODE_8105_length_2919_cov_4.539362_2_plen_39_part_00